MRSAALILLILISSNGLCQSRFEAERDSFLTVLKTEVDDTTKVMTLLEFGWWWENYDMDSAATCYRKLGELSRKINFTEGELRYYANYTFVLNHQGKYDESLKLNLESVALAKKKGSRKQLARCLFNTGSSYNNMTRYHEAIVYYLDAVKVFELLGDINSLAIAYGNIGGVFTNINQPDKGLEYTLKGLEKARLVDNKQQEATFLITAGICSSKIKQFEKAEKYLNEGVDKAKKVDSRLIEMQGCIALTELYMLVNQIDKSIAYGKLALEAAKEIGSKYNEMDALQILMQAYLKKKDTKETIKYAEMGIQLGKKNNITGHLNDFYHSLAIAKAENGDFKSGYKYLTITYDIEDSINQKEITKKIEQLEISYQTAQKEKQILQIQHEHKNQQILIWVLVVSVVIVLIISFLVYLNLRSKKRNAEQRNLLIKGEIYRLHQSQQLLAAESVMKGQEEERSRLAKDLHDGVGGMLSGIKLSLTTMKGNMIMPQEQVHVFERSLDMLDHSMKELRQVAHNLMPETLVKFGLPSALKDFSDFVNQSNAVRVIFQQVGEEKRFDANAELILYRIANELINNALRHAKASEIIIQLHYEVQLFTLTIEDNGKGFDKEILSRTTGSGWPNIKSRINYLKGTIDIDTEPGQGTAVSITIPL